MNYEPRPDSDDFEKAKNAAQNAAKNITEQMEVAADQVVERVKELTHEGNIRTIRLKHDGRTFVELPLTAVAVGGALTALIAPQIAILGAIAGAIARVTVEIERTDGPVDALKKKVEINIEDEPKV